ncbi:hypothetical protein [Roseovarius sp.]|uniref:hypothetical protein n=1 Tax=Roseovarius sp. TaxID=1486281 RepID=UPI003B5CC055
MLTRETLDAHAAQDTPPAFTSAPMSDEAIALLGYQRTKQISPRSRKSWEAGNPVPLRQEARERRDTIFAGALAEMWVEYLPLRSHLRDNGIAPASVIDIGCGQALPDLFLHHDFKPRFTLVDIERTDEQYHNWAGSGAGYASLDEATALLHGNGVAKTKVKPINPLKTPEAMAGLKADMLISFYSCGFHYPVDDYADLMRAVLEAGGTVCLDLRKRYLRRMPDTLARLLEAGRRTDLFEDPRSFRVVLTGG